MGVNDSFRLVAVFQSRSMRMSADYADENGFRGLDYLIVISTGITPVPYESVPMALPRIEPRQSAGAPQRMAWPGVLAVVRRSPGLIGPFSVETFTGTRPASVNGTRNVPDFVSKV